MKGKDDQPFDPIALRIGAAYRRGLQAYVEAGKGLLEKKASLKHGEWLPWLRLMQMLWGSATVLLPHG